MIPSELQDLRLYSTDIKLHARWAEMYPLWKRLYPHLDVMQEIRKAHAWELENELKKARVRFLGAWLRRAAEKMQVATQKNPYKAPERIEKAACNRCDGSGFVRINVQHERYGVRAALVKCDHKGGQDERRINQDVGTGSEAPSDSHQPPRRDQRSGNQSPPWVSQSGDGDLWPQAAGL